jgi:hypothetical protein
MDANMSSIRFTRKTIVSGLTLALAGFSQFCGAAGPSLFFTPGFRTFSADQYIVDTENISSLEAIKDKLMPLKITGFSTSMSGNNWLVCRMSFPVYPPGKMPYEEFIAEAMRSELTQAGLYSEDAKVGIKGHIVAMDFSSFGSGKWSIEVRFEVDQREPITIKHEYAFPLSFLATKSCQNVTDALVPAVQSFLNVVYKDERFLTLTKLPEASVPSQIQASK